MLVNVTEILKDSLGEREDSKLTDSTLRLAEHVAAEIALNTLANKGPSKALPSKVLILHIADVEVRGTKMMGDTPRIIVVVGTIGTSTLSSSFLEPKGFIDSTLNCHSSKPNKSIVYVIDLVQ
ncbi:hypothetical protein RHGRI_029506 [Rhododendron griersonianum]|uniref:Uncharacterized protein n=1 Tax=Rhododendron griersonianum TaxID=479676 RepID=A0AAV6IMX0_9ERIC|nr:hypothetical protein RHGRI_029506 [Rhododendron griersonianum]